jgi:hypothetical protein
MKGFKTFYKDYSINQRLVESLKGELIIEGSKATSQLTHLEDLIFTRGKEGYEIARSIISDLLSHLQGKSKRKIGTTVKWDGKPTIFVGRHPNTGKFFVGTKSIFNKEPKFNYTDHDIEMNHDSSGLVDILKRALKYTSKLGIKGILEGDFMFDSSSLKKGEIDGVMYYTFKPNNIKYAVEIDSDLGRKIGQSVFGIVFHTRYDSLNSEPDYNVSVKSLNEVPGVWVDDAFFKDDTGIVDLTQEESSQVKSLLRTADSLNINYKNLPLDLLNIYLNHEVKSGKYISDAESSYKSFIDWFKQRMDKEVSMRKSKVSKQRVEESFKKKLAEIESENKNITNLLKVSKLLSQAKEIFISKYSNAIYNTKHFIDNGDGTLSVTSPDGYVAINRAGNAVRLIDRLKYSNKS